MAKNHGCPFSWEWLKDNLKDKSQRYIRDRMESLEREIAYQEDDGPKRDLPRLFALKGYLTYRYAQVEGNQLQNDGINYFKRALKECQEQNHGYKYVILKCLKHVGNDEDKKAEISFQQTKINFDDQMLIHEVYAMEAYVAGHFHLRDICMKRYEKAGNSRAEWCFGMALVKEKHFSQNPSSGQLWKILDSLNKAILLDDTYVEAKLKKSKFLIKENG